jgi:hypothetical protein
VRFYVELPNRGGLRSGSMGESGVIFPLVFDSATRVTKGLSDVTDQLGSHVST